MENNLFRKYTGTKTVEAMPATAIEAKRKFNANIPDRVVGANPGKEGYVIDYPDGYRSWCPKKEFEDSYKISETFIDRMKIELEDLTEKICKGTATFLRSRSIPEDQRWLLGKQLNVMRDYADIVRQRIELAEKENNQEAGVCPSCTVDPSENYGKE